MVIRRRLGYFRLMMCLFSHSTSLRLLPRHPTSQPGMPSGVVLSNLSRDSCASDFNRSPVVSFSVRLSTFVGGEFLVSLPQHLCDRNSIHGSWEVEKIIVDLVLWPQDEECLSLASHTSDLSVIPNDSYHHATHSILFHHTSPLIIK